ncbi:hypothetical protein E2C01_058620 [Portunus trituberculatus]|uniref:Uncharacterized protein n=1 Tax=Portunus trituberculatus TaxID=210409 RepID=A0A5B7H373_PORTR|nr:hypothetical protein [Portunus trituberculatus]
MFPPHSPASLIILKNQGKNASQY